MNNKKLTLKKFKEYESQICKVMGFSKGVWREYQKDIIDCFGYYDKNVSYAGRGDSREFSISEVIVPELFDNFCYYVHDGFYKLIKDCCRYNCFKDKADEIMKEMMEIKANRPTFLPEIYLFFVRWFG